jgi:hypothetical protein
MPDMHSTHRRKRGFFHDHSLSIAYSAVLLLWICLYVVSNPNTHVGSFSAMPSRTGTGTVVMVLATKFLYEGRSPESRRCPKTVLWPAL